MGIIQDEEQKIVGWVLKDEIPVAIQAGASALVGLLSSAKVASLLAMLGITIDPAKLGHTLVTYGTALAAATVTHLGASYAKNKASNTSAAIAGATPPPVK